MREIVHFMREDSPFDGQVTVQVLPFLERNKMLKQFNTDSEALKEGNLEDGLKAMERLVELSQKYLIELQVCKGDYKFKDLEDVDYDVDAGAFYNEIGSVILKGAELGNVSRSGLKASVDSASSGSRSTRLRSKRS